MCESPLSPSNHCFGINKIDRSYVLNRPTILPDRVQLRYLQQQQILSLNQVCLYEARIVLKQSTSLVGGKLKFKQWKITKAKGTKFNYANRYIKIKLGSILQRGVKWLGNEENLYINVLELMSAKFSILTFTKGQSNIVIHLQIDSKTALSHLFQMGVTHNRELSHIS